MKTEDFSPKANLTKAGNGDAFADIARNTWSGAEKLNATPQAAGEAGVGPNVTKPNEGTATPKSGAPEQLYPQGSGHAAPGGKGQGEAAAGKDGGAAGGGGEFGKAGAHPEQKMQNGSSEGHRGTKDSQHDAKPAGSDASGMPGTKDKSGAAGSDLNSAKRDQRSDSSLGYKLPDMVII